MKPAYSHSRIDLFHRCPEAYRRRYIERQRTPVGIAAHAGSGLDQAANAALIAKSEGQPVPTLEELTQMGLDGFKRGVDTGTSFRAAELEEGENAVVGRYSDNLVGLVRAWVRDILPEVSPRKGRIQWRWKLETEEAYDLIGVTDLETTSGAVLDNKAKPGDGASWPTQAEVDHTTQLTMYALNHEAHDGELPSAVGYAVVRHGTQRLKKDGTPVKGSTGTTGRIMWSRRTAADIWAFWNRLDSMHETIEAGNFPGARQGIDWWCSADFCSYAGTCPFFARRVAVQVPAEEVSK